MKAGIWELLIVLAIALLIFGPKALPKLGKSLGKTVGNFKKGLGEDEEDEEDDDDGKSKKTKKSNVVEAADPSDEDGEV